jgi:hypothetical protein
MMGVDQSLLFLICFFKGSRNSLACFPGEAIEGITLRKLAKKIIWIKGCHQHLLVKVGAKHLRRKLLFQAMHLAANASPLPVEPPDRSLEMNRSRSFFATLSAVGIAHPTILHQTA